MRVFYAVFIRDEPLRSCFNAIRLLYNPLTKHEAHITVRGPYRQRYPAVEEHDPLRGAKVNLYGGDHFLGHRGQSTVFLRGAARNLRQVWHKPDFSFIPHLTLYDGDDRRLALELYQELTRYPINVSFITNGLEPLVSNGAPAGLQMFEAIDFDVLSEACGRDVDIDMILSDRRRARLDLVSRICRYLALHSEAELDPEADVGDDDAGVGIKLPPGWSMSVRPVPTTHRSGAQDAAISISRTAASSALDEFFNAWRFLHRRIGTGQA